MDAATLAEAFGNSYGVDYAAELDGFRMACRVAGLHTVARRAMFIAQVGEETGGLRWSQELADGAEYNWRADLGNSVAGDGPRYKGRGYLQLTGRSNYAAFSRWAHDHGMVASPTYFLDFPDEVAARPWRWLSAAHYWAGAHPHDGMTHLNEAADARNILTATHMVNGGENGLADRTARWRRALTLGARLLDPPAHTHWLEDLMGLYDPTRKLTQAEQAERAAFELRLHQIVHHEVSQFFLDDSDQPRRVRFFIRRLVPGARQSDGTVKAPK